MNTDRPSSVQNAVWLLYGALGVGILYGTMHIGFFSHPIDDEKKIDVFTTLITWCFWAFLISKIGKGRNWARITALVLFIIGSLYVIPVISHILQLFALSSLSPLPLITILLSICSWAMQAFALALLFRKPSSDWFKRVKASGKQGRSGPARTQGGAETMQARPEAASERPNEAGIRLDKPAGSRGSSSPDQARNAAHDQPRGTDAAALKYLSDMAEYGDLEAQCELGLIYAEGRGVAGDDARAVHWFWKAAEQGHIAAQYNLGIMHQEGRGTPKNDVAAVQWHQKAAEQGHVEALCSLGRLYQAGGGVPKDDARAVRCFRQAAEQGHAEAQYTLALCCATGRGVAKNDAQAVKWFLHATVQGHAEAQYALARNYGITVSIATDDVQAARRHQEAAEEGESQAVQWYRKAADQGDAEAQYRLGVAYHYGEGVGEDRHKAFEWLQKSAKQGYAQAQRLLREKNFLLYLLYLFDMVDYGDAEAQFELGGMYEEGSGISKDDAQAVQWYQKAAEQGHAEALDALTRYGITVDKK